MTAVTEESALGRETGRSAGKIGLSLLVAIGLGYVLTVVCGRLLSVSDYGVFLSFWGVLMGLGSALSPLEQELSRQSSEAALHGGRAGKPALRAVTIGVAVVAAFCLLTFLPPVTDKLYGGHTELAVIVLLGGISFVFQFSTRGLLIGQNKIRHFSWLIIAEAGARALILGALIVAGVAHLVPLAIAVAAGSFAWFLFARPASKLLDPHLEGESWKPISSRVLLLMLGAGLTASVITGYPALAKGLAPTGHEEQMSVLFASLTVARVPLLLISPLQSLAVPTVVRLSQTIEGLHKLRRLLAVGALGALVLGAIGALCGLVIGPWAVKLLYGAKYVAEGWWVAGLVWSSVMLTAVQLMTAVLVAQTKVKKVVVTWGVIAVISALILLFFPADAVLRSVVGLVAGPTVGLAVVVGFVVRRATSPSTEKAQR